MLFDMYNKCLERAKFEKELQTKEMLFLMLRGVGIGFFSAIAVVLIVIFIVKIL